ncbi:hypothetical protein [Nocardia sp. alder85J]|uniref:hypothetical protein n=1 Tax=Nocardia sp. alder85J TaxID=2862949 RepID=UPI001CD4350C|nr:hypothetical protein [Nocardia sp. alder85J]MCX4098368.1 hypothetical protein [Nocardia sp. alder85J]
MPDMDTALKEMMMIDGALGAAVVDYNSGMALGMSGGSRNLDLDVAAAGNTEVVRAKQRTLEQLGIDQGIEDILISLTGQYHLLRPMASPQSRGLFLYLALDRNRANLALARHRLRQIEDSLLV